MNKMNEAKLNYDYLTILDEKNNEKYYGGDQEWYSTFIKRMALGYISWYIIRQRKW